MTEAPAQTSGGNGSPVRVLMLTKDWPSPGQPWRAPFVFQQYKFLAAAGADVDFFTFPGQKNPANYLRAWVDVRKRLRSRKYDVIHAQFGQSGMLALPKTRPLVVTFRGSDLEGIVGADGRFTAAGRLLRGISRTVARAADAVCLVSESMSRHLPAGVRYEIVPSGLDLELFKPGDRAAARRELGLPADGRLILFGGNPAVARKRHGLASAAVALLAARVPATLVAAGQVAHDRMPLWMNACDALLLTSVHEGSPNVVKEALACNVPVVSVDVGDVRQRIGGIPGCRVCADDRAETIADALAEVLARPGPFDGRSAVAELDERRLVRRMIDIYRAAIARFDGARR